MMLLSILASRATFQRSITNDARRLNNVIASSQLFSVAYAAHPRSGPGDHQARVQPEGEPSLPTTQSWSILVMFIGLIAFRRHPSAALNTARD